MKEPAQESEQFSDLELFRSLASPYTASGRLCKPGFHLVHSLYLGCGVGCALTGRSPTTSVVVLASVASWSAERQVEGMWNPGSSSLRDKVAFFWKELGNVHTCIYSTLQDFFPELWGQDHCVCREPKSEAECDVLIKRIVTVCLMMAQVKNGFACGAKFWWGESQTCELQFSKHFKKFCQQTGPWQVPCLSVLNWKTCLREGSISNAGAMTKIE